MTRLIDADALLKELRKSCEYHAENSREFSLLQRDIIIVQEQPTIDAVPVDMIKGRINDLKKILMNIDEDDVDEIWDLRMKIETLTELFEMWEERKEE